MPSWKRITRERPPATQQAALVVEPASGRVLLAAVDEAPRGKDEGRTQEWELAEDGWSCRRRGLFPGPTRYHGPPVAWAEAGRVAIGRLAENGLHTLDGDRAALHEGPFPSWMAEAHATFCPALGKPLLVVCPESDASAFAIDGPVLVPLGAAPYIHALTVDAEGRAVGYDIDGTLHAFDGTTWSAIGRGPRMMQGLAFHPKLERLVTLCPTGDEGMALAAWDDTQFVWVEPNVVASTFRNGGRLAVTPDGGVVYFGGQDFDARRGGPTNGSLRAAPGGTELRPDDVASPPPPRQSVAITTDRTLFANASSGEIVDSDWKSVCEPHRSLDSRCVHFAASPSQLFELDGDGVLHAAPHRGAFVPVAVCKALAGRASKRLAIAWDPPSGEVVAFGGPDDNATWVTRLADGAIDEVRPPAPPPHGVGTMASTPSGVFLLVQGELYRWTERRWECVANDVPGTTLLFDARRTRLFSAGRDGATSRIWAIDRTARATPVVDGPAGARFGDAIVAIDPAGDRVLVLGERDLYAVPLSELEGAEGMPLSPCTPATARHASPPPDMFRRAIKLVRGEETSAPPLGLEGDLVAILPARQEMPLPPGVAAIAVSMTPRWHETSAEPWRLGGGGVFAKLVLASELADPRTILGEGDVACSLLEEAYVEIDPEHVEEVDSPPHGTSGWVFGSKLGGYPRFAQGDPRDEWKGAPLRFVAQISTDLFDQGTLFVFVDDEAGRAHVVLQR